MSNLGSLGSKLRRAAAANLASQRRFRAGKEHLGGADRVRTDDLRLARAALSQLSYSPFLRGPLRPERPAIPRNSHREWWA